MIGLRCWLVILLVIIFTVLAVGSIGRSIYWAHIVVLVGVVVGISGGWGDIYDHSFWCIILLATIGACVR